MSVRKICRHGDDGLGDGRIEVRLRGLLHLRQHHRRDLLRGEELRLALVLHLDHRLSAGVAHHLEGPVFGALPHEGVLKASSNESLGVEDGVRRIGGHLGLRGVSDQPFRVGEGDHRWRHAVALVIGDDLHPAVLEDAHAGVGSAQVDANCGHFETVD